MNGILKLSHTIERAGSGKGWLSELCGGRSKFRGGELSGITSRLREILLDYLS